MFFYAFEMAISMPSPCINMSDQICTQPDQTLLFSNLYGRAPRWFWGVKFFFTNKSVEFLPFWLTKPREYDFQFEFFFSSPLPLCHQGIFACNLSQLQPDLSINNSQQVDQGFKNHVSVVRGFWLFLPGKKCACHLHISIATTSSMSQLVSRKEKVK